MLHSAEIRHQLQTIPVEIGSSASHVEIHSGIMRYTPRIYGNLVSLVGAEQQTGFIIVHPTSNFLGHHLLGPFAQAGLPIIGLNTRYVGNDTTVIMENTLLDIGAAIRWSKEVLGWERTVLIGFSGGGSLVSYYQAQAESPESTAHPIADLPDVRGAGLLPADALALVAAHPGRAELLSKWIDPSVHDEADPDIRDWDLDLYAGHRAVPLDRQWLERYRFAQIERMDRIDTWVLSEIERLRSLGIGDRAFVVHRTVADPRFVDLSIDPSDRVAGSMYGDPKVANEAAGTLARTTTLRSWISGWSLTHSRASAIANLPKVSVPVAIVHCTADEVAMPEEADALRQSAPERVRTFIELQGMNHYFLQQPDAPAQAADAVRAWAIDIGLPVDRI